MGGTLELPARELVLVDGGDGGHLVVEPPRAVWERSELAAGELAAWSCLVAAAGRAMLETLPQLEGGCINYWEAGNWSLHADAPPAGAKSPRRHRKVHLHLLGRSPAARSPALRWGEAPSFPDYADRLRWAASNRRLEARDCVAIVGRTAELLRRQYGFEPAQIAPGIVCEACGYPTAEAGATTRCSECPAR